MFKNRLTLYTWSSKCAVLSQLLSSVMSSLTVRDHIVSWVVYEIIFWGQTSRADAGQTGTRDESSDKCHNYQIKILIGQDKIQLEHCLTSLIPADNA